MSNEVGYSPYYCSSLFHKICGVTLKSYLAGRRLCYAAIALRDTTDRIIDIALRYGFSSQEALTRAFVSAYGCTPYAYRMNPRPIKLAVKQVVLTPGKNMVGGIGIWDIQAKGYGDFWRRPNCDDICGLIDSMRPVSLEVVGCHQAGWFYENGQKGYFYGFGMRGDYAGKVPEGFEIRDIPLHRVSLFSPTL